MIKVFLKDKIFEVGVGIWSAGEVRLIWEDKEEFIKEVTRCSYDSEVELLLENDYNSNNLLALSLLVDIFKDSGYYFITVSLPYLPYSRQERKTADSPYIGINIVKKLLGNDVHIITKDAHAGSTKYGNLGISFTSINTSLPSDVEKELKGNEKIVFISPDKGAEYRVKYKQSVLNAYGNNTSEFFCVEKERVNGNVVSKLPESIKSLEGNDHTTFIVVDDICDGGRTFVNVAELINTLNIPNKKLILSVTHGIFSSSSTKKRLEELYDVIHVANHVKCHKYFD